MLSRGMRDKPIEISQGSLGSLRVTAPFPSLKVGGGGEGTATQGTLPEFLYQRHLEVKDSVTAKHGYFLTSPLNQSVFFIYII